ncbi:hypothetical protein [Alkalihalobacterium bogoriense]|uniref:hypothetical protein n=1 Tax=Alkalihalobacterium bogoriense TaxID=246272 RepID=UPI00047BAD93|nr:hypothetical protein [Alkalihalobacterium bogoriense]
MHHFGLESKIIEHKRKVEKINHEAWKYQKERTKRRKQTDIDNNEKKRREVINVFSALRNLW